MRFIKDRNFKISFCSKFHFRQFIFLCCVALNFHLYGEINRTLKVRELSKGIISGRQKQVTVTCSASTLSIRELYALDLKFLFSTNQLDKLRQRLYALGHRRAKMGWDRDDFEVNITLHISVIFVNLKWSQGTSSGGHARVIKACQLQMKIILAYSGPQESKETQTFLMQRNVYLILLKQTQLLIAEICPLRLSNCISLI